MNRYCTTHRFTGLIILQFILIGCGDPRLMASVAKPCAEGHYRSRYMRAFTVGLFLLSTSALLSVSAPVRAGHYDDESFVVRCESIRGRDNYCPIDTSGGVFIQVQLSSTDCIEGETWGSDRGGIWVRSGCRADFEVPRAYSSGRGWQSQRGYGRPWQDEQRGNAGTGRRVVCESYDRRATQCPVRVRNDVELVYQMSSAECRFNWSWGFDGQGIWVDRGCRAEFLVY
jgi:Protein of unknown function (DUF3011)